MIYILGMNLRKRNTVKYTRKEGLEKELSKARLIRALPVSENSNFYEVCLNKTSQQDVIPVQEGQL